MTGFIVLLIIIVAVVAVVKSKKKKKDSLATAAPVNKVATPTVPESHPLPDSYVVHDVERTAVQVLETTHIIGSSKALDTVQGRYQFLMQILPTLAEASDAPQYQLQIQRALDHYKSVYYNTIPQDFQLAIVLKPKEFDLAQFYCKSLGMTFKRFFEEQVEAIKLLKKDDAKKRRLQKIREILLLTKTELSLHCSAAKSFAEMTAAFDSFEERLQHGDTTSDGTKVMPDDTPKTQTSTVTSISRKASSATNQDIVLNAKTVLPLTLLKADKSVAQQIKKILDDENMWDGQKRDQITALFAEYNLEVREIEEYRAKYSPLYHQKLDELKRASPDWESANALDREDILADLRPIALRSIYERANCDLVTLFECEPEDVTADDILIKQYGFESFETYLRFADNIDKVRVIPNDSYNRDKFVRLVEVGLAIRGSSIPIAEILSGLTLKVLNEIASNPDKEFKRKNLAIDYIMTKEGYEDLVSSKVALLELFKLQPLPEKYSSINIKAIAASWKYTYTVVELFVHSYRSASEARRRAKEDDFVKSFLIENYTDEAERCPRANEFKGKTIPRSQNTPVPCHVGCNCELRLVFR